MSAARRDVGIHDAVAAARAARPTAAVQLAKAMGGSYRAHESLVRGCLELLALWRVPARPIHTGPRVTPRAGGGFDLRCNAAQHGVSDIMACFPDSGLLVLIEGKTGGASRSPEQVEFQREFERAGALCLVIRSVDELQRVLERYVPRRGHGGKR